jgi:ribonuclease G
MFKKICNKVKHTVKHMLGYGKCDPLSGSTIVINAEKLERRVAFLDDGIIQEYSFERNEEDNIVGSIFKGKVKNIEQGLKAMFVDIGLEKNAFLHFWDAIPAALDAELEEIERAPRKQAKKKISSKDIPDIYPIGSDIIVQVTKGPIGTKGPRVTTNVSLAGRFLVLMPYTEQFGISRKIEDPVERKRLRNIMAKLEVPEGMGIIMRTVAQNKKARHFVRDLASLVEQWEKIEEERDQHDAPVRIFKEPGLVEKTVRDFLAGDDVDYIVCDDEQTTEEMQQIVGTISRRSKRKIQYFPTARGLLFEELHIQRQLDEASQRQVFLPCGGYLVIDETEALIAIDVNTGRNKGKDEDLDKTILQTNMEAATEIARQLRLRNIGGLVVVDFIDMRHRKDQQAVYKQMKEGLKRDKAKTQVLQMSGLGLMEMTRQRLNESFSVSVHDPCPFCHGRGHIKSVLSMSIELQRQLNSVIKRYKGTVGDLLILMNADVLSRLKKEDSKLIEDIERTHTGHLIFRGDPGIHREKFAIYDAKYPDNRPLYESTL